MDSLQYLKTQLEEAKDKKDEMLIYRAEKALKEFEICATSETIDDLQRNLELGGFAPAITDEGMSKSLEAAEANGDSAAITREIVRQARLKAKSRIEAAQAARIGAGVDVDRRYVGIQAFHEKSRVPKRAGKGHPLSKQEKERNRRIGRRRIV